MMTLSPLQFMFPVFALAFAAAATAKAPYSTDPGQLPLCALPHGGDQGACRLPVANGGFERPRKDERPVPYWDTTGVARLGHESDNAYAVLNVGERARQVVAADVLIDPRVHSYVLHFRYRVTAAEGAVNARLSLSDRDGIETEMLGETALAGAVGEWRNAELVVAGKRWSGEMKVQVDIGNFSPFGLGIVDIDDVYLVSAPLDAR
jgi:hypothetical protein